MYTFADMDIHVYILPKPFHILIVISLKIKVNWLQ